MNRFWSSLLGVAALGLTLVLGGCGGSAQQLYLNEAVSCPVPPSEAQATFSGAYGVDGLNRPVNAHGFPVDVAGNCLLDHPVETVWHVRPSPVYVDYYRSHWGVWYQPSPIILLTPHIFIGSGVPSGRVTVIRNYSAPPRPPVVTRTTVPAGAPSQTVRPNSVAPAAPGQTVRPGAPAGPIAAPVQPVKPPAVAPAAPAVQPPAKLTPTNTGGPSKVFNRPTQSAPAAAPQRMAPSGGGGASRTFSRPPRR